MFDELHPKPAPKAWKCLLPVDRAIWPLLPRLLQQALARVPPAVAKVPTLRPMPTGPQA